MLTSIARLPLPVRRDPAAGTQSALVHLSNGYCYWPGCVQPILLELEPGNFRKNVQIAHIVGVKKGAARYREMPVEERDSFANLMLLCLPHHSEIDDRKTGATKYPEELLLEWKKRREGASGPVLARLRSVDEDRLMEYLASIFEPPIDRLQAIADQLEETGVLNAESVAELQLIISRLRDVDGPRASTARNLAFAAEALTDMRLDRTAARLGDIVDVLPRLVNDLERAVRRLPDY